MQNAILIVILAAAIVAAGWVALRRLRRGSACCGEHEAAPKRTGPALRDKSRYPYAATLKIGGMTCENCARRVENALNALDGTWAKVRIDTRAAEVRTLNPPDEAALRDAVRKAGYVVSDIQRQ